MGDRPPAGSVLYEERVEAHSREAALAELIQRLIRRSSAVSAPMPRPGPPSFKTSASRDGAWRMTTAVVWRFVGPVMEVIQPGMETTVQDWPGRLGAWEVGVPSSGPIDSRSFRLANKVVGNPEGAPGFEILLSGPSLRFAEATTVAVTGATVSVTVDGDEQPMYSPILVPAGSVLSVGAANQRGLRSYVAIRGGVRVPEYLGSASTFALGGFGGHAGRSLVAGDLLDIGGVESSLSQGLSPNPSGQS